jgi:hypothetical protein
MYGQHGFTLSAVRMPHWCWQRDATTGIVGLKAFLSTLAVR